MIVVTSTPPDPVGGPPAQIPPRQTSPLSYQWEAWTGDSWNLVDPAGKVLKIKGSTGFGFAPVTHWYDDAPGIPGSAWAGTRDERGSLFLPLEVYGDDSADFLIQHRAFVRSLHPRQTGILRVTTPDGRTRYARCRYADGLDAAVDIDPVAACRVRYGITWNRDDPYWLGETVTATFTNEVAPTFFAAPGSGVVINIASSNVMDAAEVTNPGDEPVFPRWTVTGPCATFTVGVGRGTSATGLTMTPNLAAGESLIIDMDPRALTILDETGTDLGLSAASDVSFDPIPAGDDIPLNVSATGTSAAFSITLEFTAAYRSAW